ncbi:hypothetical protein H0H87_005150, partial [Tephrocybe sp. NHM501043]
MTMPHFGLTADAIVDTLQISLFDPSQVEEGLDQAGSLLTCSLLHNTDTFMYLGHKFKHRKIPVFEEIQLNVGDK